MVKNRLPLLRGPLRMLIEVSRNYPKSWPPKRCAVTDYITGKPDWDNTAKLIGDALNGICFEDDAQIADGRLVRRYHTSAEQITVTIEELSDNIPPPRQARRHMLGAS
jgi:Holliday junction resolvase RusA-like endonuclease